MRRLAALILAAAVPALAEDAKILTQSAVRLDGGAGGTGGVTDGDKGDITVASGTWTIDDAAVTFAKMVNASAASKLVGRGSAAGAGVFQEISLGTNLSMSGTTLNATGGVTNGAGANVVTKSDGTNLVASSITDNATTLTLGNAGVTVTEATGVVTITSQNAASTPLVVAGASGQTEPHIRLGVKDAALNAGLIKQSAQAQGASTLAGLGVTLKADDAVAGSTNAGAGAGGAITITSGDAKQKTSGNAAGGAINLTTGAGVGTGAYGNVVIANGTLSLPAGSGTVPSWKAGTSMGAYSRSGVTVTFLNSTSEICEISNNGLWLGLGTFGLASAAPASGADTFLSRNAPAVWQLGAADGATPVAQTLGFQGATGNNAAGQVAKLRGSLGTGTATPTPVVVTAAALGTGGGSGKHTAVSRVVINGVGSALTSGAAASLFDVPLAASPSYGGGQVLYTIAATDGTEQQVCSGQVNWSARRTGAGPTYAQASTVVSETCTASSGALSTAWALVAGTAKMTMQVTPTVTVITPTIFEITYEIHSQGRSDVAALPF